MKNPIDSVTGRIVDYNPYTHEMTIKAVYPDWFTLSKREYKECLVQMIDSRPLSSKQRNACYALIRAISEYTGMGEDEAKEWMKIKFITEDLEQTADKLFSLSNASMSLVCSFQSFLIDIVVSWDIPTRFSLIEAVDDIERYIYSCAVNKKCVVCGQHADLHHVLPIGMSANRKVMVHEGLEVLPLCRIHHTEMHQYTRDRFYEMYHIDHGIPADKTICKIYNLKANQDEID